MSILIKGMKMPTNCQQCPCAYWVNQFTFIGCNVKPGKRYAMSDGEYRNLSTRPDWCPLVEVPTPHGRLIDKDAFEKDLAQNVYANKRKIMSYPTVVSNTILKAPTIIEAEE